MLNISNMVSGLMPTQKKNPLATNLSIGSSGNLNNTAKIQYNPNASASDVAGYDAQLAALKAKRMGTVASPTPSPFQGQMTSTPSTALFKPNTTSNIAYGGSTNVPSGSFTSAPTQNLFPASNGLIPTQSPQITTEKAPIASTAVASTGGATLNGAQVDANGNLTSPGSNGLDQTTLNQNNNPQINTNQNTNQNNPTFAGLISLLTSQAQDTSGIDKANADLQTLRKNYADQTGNIERAGTDLSLQTGQEGTLNRLFATKESAAQSALTNALTARGQSLGALNNASGLTKPELGSVGTQSFYNPLTGMPNQGTGANTPFSGGVAQGNVSLGQQYAANVSANNQAKAVKNNINTFLDQNPTLNPSDFSQVNSAIQFLSGHVSDPRYQVLSNYLTEYVNTLAPILGVGGDTTNLKTQIAQGFVNAHQSGQSIKTVLDGIEQLAQAKLDAQQGGSQGNTQSNATTNSGSIWSF